MGNEAIDKELEVEKLRAEVAALELQKALLQADYDRLQQLYDKVPLGYQSLDENGHFLSVNQTWLDVLGYRREEVIGRNFADFLHPEWQEHFRENFPRFKAIGEILGVEFEMRSKDGRFILTAFDGKIGRDYDGHFRQTHCIFRDITTRRAEEARREAERELLRICHLATDTRELVEGLVTFFQELTRCEAVGIRLRQGEDFPYYESSGFPRRFIKTENLLCGRTPEGCIVRDDAGRPEVKCMCGNILYRRFDPALPFFTERGSFWTSSTTELLTATTEADRQAPTCNRCNGEGYESAALIPFRLREEIYGLLQLNDRAPGRFTPQLIGQLEDLVAYVSLSLSKHLADSSRQESEERLATFAAATFEGIIEAKAGEILDCNEQLGQLLGYQVEELKGMQIVDLVAPEDRDRVLSIIRNGKESIIENEMLRMDGTRVTVEAHGRPVGHGDIRHTAIRDITDRRRREEELRESRQVALELMQEADAARQQAEKNATALALADWRMQQALLASHSFTFDWDNATDLAVRSDSCGPILGLAGGAAIQDTGQDYFQRIHPDDRDRFVLTIKALTPESPGYSAEYRVVRGDGTIIVLEETGQAQFDANGSMEKVFGVTTDISKRKRAEELAEQRLGEMEELYRNTPVGLCVLDRDLRFVRINERLAEINGIPGADHIGKTVRELLPHIADAVEQGMRHVLRTGEPKLDIEIVAETPAQPGVQRSWMEQWLPIKDSEGCVVGLNIVAEETTRRKQYEEELKTLNDELERRVEQRTYELQVVQQQYLHAEKLSAIGKLSASIAHEFNNPLQSVMTVLKGLKKTAGLEGGDMKMLDLAIGESERMKKLIASLRDFYRPSSDRKSFIDVHQTIESILTFTKSDFGKKKIAVTIDFSPHLPQIFAVPDQFKQVLLNLLTNAIDACTGSGKEIKISTYQEGDHMAVAIEDTGIGITAKNMEHIFRPFFTTKAEVKGIGLGLPVSYGIVKAHKGEIRVESEPGVGTTFTVLLPINSEESILPFGVDAVGRL